jgi:enoyl-CoA hydratase/carnithine racemase
VTDVLAHEQRDGVALLRLNRPDQMNALNGAMVDALGAAVVAADADPSVRVVVVTGAGSSFCAGADLIEAEAMTRDAAAFRGWLLGWKRSFDSLQTCRKPVIAALNGVTLAGGLELALSCDFIVASSRAKVGDVHANYGLVPGGGGSQRLTDAVGSRAARLLMYTGQILTADAAHALGLVQQVFEAESFDDDVRKLAEKMATRSAPGLAFMKRLSATSHVTDQGLQFEIEAAAHLVMAPDAREGLSAFRAKRTPQFTEVLDGR